MKRALRPQPTVSCKTSVLLATLCALATLSGHSEPSASPNPVKEQKNIPYAADGNSRHTLDLFSPAERDEKPLPLLVSIHGGAWLLGSKEFCPVKFAIPHGFIVASIGYRLTNEGTFPRQLEDCQAALKFLVEHAAEYGIDPGKILISGDSAGGHLALLLGMAPFPADANVKRAMKIRGIVDFYGPTDLPGYLADAQAIKPGTRAEKEIHDDAVVRLLGGTPAQKPELAKAASPLTYVSPQASPVMILQGEDDQVVPPAQSERLHAALDKVGVHNEYVLLPKAIHSDLRFWNDAMQRKVLTFMEEAVK